MTDIASRRKDYESAGLDVADVDADPMTQWQQWYDQASQAGCVEPNAFVLSTVDGEGWPQSRYLLARGADSRGFSFFTNYESAKGTALAAVPYAAAVFAWIAHERQVRISGPTTRIAPEETAAYFASRPRGAQIGAAVSPQSQVIASRESLERAFADAEERWSGVDVPLPTNWGGYRITPEVVEFWQGRDDRLHDRLRYRLENGSWALERLAP